MSNDDRDSRPSCTYILNGKACGEPVDPDVTPSRQDCRPAWCKECLHFNKERMEIEVAQLAVEQSFYTTVRFGNELASFASTAEGEYQRIGKPDILTALNRWPRPEVEDFAVARASCIKLAGILWEQQACGS